MKKKLIILSILLFVIPFVSASISCSPTSLSTIFLRGSTVSDQTISCVNNENTTVTVSKSGFYFSIDQTSIGSLEQKDVIISFDNSAPKGTHYNIIQFSDSSTSIPVTITSQEQQQVGGCTIDVFPTTLTNIKIPQGEVKSRQILITVPECFPGKINFRAVDLGSNVRPIELGELALGEISPGNSVNIPLLFDTDNIQTGTYFESISMNIANSTGYRISVPSVSISVTVTKGISPIGEDGFSTLPTCSLTSTDMNLNSTEQLICTNTNPNINIEIIPNNYIRGLKVEEVGNQFIYTFIPELVGNTIIEYYFSYKGAQIGNLQSQEIRITSGGQAVAGVSQKMVFYPESDPSTVSPGTSVSVLPHDNKTGNIIADFDVYLNGALLKDTDGNPTNSFTVNSGETYTVSITSPGYSSIEKTFSLNPKSISLTISPSGEVNIGSNITITTTPEDASVFLDDVSIEKSFVTNTLGVFTIRATKEGYQEVNTTITVIEPLIVVYFPEEGKPMKKGKSYKIEFNKEITDFVMYYQEEKDGDYLEVTGATVSGKVIEFTPEEKGWYSIEVGAVSLWKQEVKGGSFSSLKSIHWGFWMGIIAVLIIIGLWYFEIIDFGGGTESTESRGPGFEITPPSG